MKYTNQQIKEMYEAEGGPELHPARATDTGLTTTGDLMKGVIFLIFVTAILVRVL